MDAIDQFRQTMTNAGLTPPDTIIADGKIHRFTTNGKRSDDAGRYKQSKLNEGSSGKAGEQTGKQVPALNSET
jgi:putative DNA primase/helicase